MTYSVEYDQGVKDGITFAKCINECEAGFDIKSYIDGLELDTRNYKAGFRCSFNVVISLGAV